MVRARSPRTFDVALAAVLVAGSVVGVLTTQLPRSREVDGWALVLAVGAALVTVTRRAWPTVTAGVVTASTALYLLVGYPYSPILVSFFVAMYSVARYRPLRQAVSTGVVALALLLVHVGVQTGLESVWEILIPRAAWVLIPVAVGVAVRQSVESAERARRELIRQHVHEERMRVSQEVHDVVGHGLAAIKMQADVALHLLQRKPEHAVVALDAISRTSAAALDELRATLTTFRHDQERRPVMGLERLPELAQRMAQAGIDVHVAVEGASRSVPSDVDLAAYRVVQESLTNVMRHSDADTVHVTVTCGGARLEVTVLNGGDPDAPESSMEGFGIDGMRERVENLGGEFSARRRPEGGFVVRAILPLGAEDR